MSLLLKCVWRHLLWTMPSSGIRTLSSIIPEFPSNKSPDILMTSIKTADCSEAVLAAVQRNLPAMDHRHMLQALRALFHLHKHGRSKEDAEKLIKDPAFITLCQNFKKHARVLEINDAIEAMKVLTFLEVPADSLIIQTMLQLIRSNINMLNLRQAMFLDFLLQKFDSKNHLIEALKLALPLVFQIHAPLELDQQDLPLLKDMLGYSCQHGLPDRCINNIVTCLLLHDQTIDVHTARSVVWSLCEVNCTEEVFPTRMQLLRLCLDVLAQNLHQLQYDEVLRTVAKIKVRVMEKHHEYYHEQLMDAIADYVINKDLDFERALLVARVLSRIAHTNLNLVEYLCTVAASEPERLSKIRTNILFGFINCLANNNHRPDPAVWTGLHKQITANPVFEGHNTSLPWTKTCLELASLGVYEDRILQKIFSEEFLQKYLSRDDNNLDYLQLLTLLEAVNTFHTTKYKLPEDILRKARSLYPLHHMTDLLREGIARGVGGVEYVAKNIVLPNGIIADVLLCLMNGHPLKLPTTTKGRTPIEELKLPENGIVVCVMNFNQGCFSMNSNRLRGTFRLIVDILEQQGYLPVPVNTSTWLSAPDHERGPYLTRELNYKCGQIGTKLYAT